MALIRNIEELAQEGGRPHSHADASYHVTTDPTAGTVVQIDTYGSDERAIPGKRSQSIQIDETTARRLIEIFRATFPSIR